MSNQTKQLNTKIQKVGREIYLVFSQNLIRTLKLNIGSKIDLAVENGAIVITPNSHRKLNRFRKKKQMRKILKKNCYSNLSNIS